MKLTLWLCMEDFGQTVLCMRNHRTFVELSSSIQIQLTSDVLGGGEKTPLRTANPKKRVGLKDGNVGTRSIIFLMTACSVTRFSNSPSSTRTKVPVALSVQIRAAALVAT